MTFKCPDCGATLKDDSKFCNYCGAKIDDGVKRMEIKIDKRIEDVAEIKRAEREDRESLRRERKERVNSVFKWIKRAFLLGLAIFALVLIKSVPEGAGLAGQTIVGVFILIAEGVYIIVSWVTSKF